MVYIDVMIDGCLSSLKLNFNTALPGSGNRIAAKVQPHLIGVAAVGEFGRIALVFLAGPYIGAGHVKPQAPDVDLVEPSLRQRIAEGDTAQPEEIAIGKKAVTHPVIVAPIRNPRFGGGWLLGCPAVGDALLPVVHAEPEGLLGIKHFVTRGPDK